MVWALIYIKILHYIGLSQEILRGLEISLRDVFLGSRITIEERVHFPSIDCLNWTRGQYNSTHILHFLHSSIRKRENEKVLAIVSVDLYTDHLNFVFGEANWHTGIAVVSTYRLRTEFYGENPSPELFRKRLFKEAIHELGHTLGLDHCPNPTCVMYFSNSILDTDQKDADLCLQCKFQLGIAEESIASLL